MTIGVTWLGHSTVVLDIDQTRIIADPLLRTNNGILRRRADRPLSAAWASAEAVLLSHLHHDHAELASLRLLGDVPVITAPANAVWVTKHGLRGVGVEPGVWVPVGKRDQVEVGLVPAAHAGRRMPHRPNAVNGHVVTSRHGTVWLAGDTELFPGLADLAGPAGGAIDIAVVPVGGWGPRLSQGHLGPAEAAVACRIVGARWAIPVHWGTLHVPFGRNLPHGWMDRAGDEFAAALEHEAPHCRPLVLKIGASVRIPTAHGRLGWSG